MSNFTLSEDDRHILDMYIAMYNHTNRQIDTLHGILREIRSSIQRITRTTPHLDNPPVVNNIASNENYILPRYSSETNENYSTSTNRAQQQRQQQRQQQSHIQPPPPVGLQPVDVSALPRTVNGAHPVTNRGLPYTVRPGQEPHNYVTYNANGTMQRWRYPYSQLPVRTRNYSEIYTIPDRPSTNTNTRTNTALHLLYTFYDPVPVIPTTTQLTQGLRDTVFSNIVTPLNSSCPITMERFEDNSNVSVILGCNHIFNPTQIRSWFITSARCPVCRYDIRDYRPAAATINENNDDDSNYNDLPGLEEESKEEDVLEESKEEESTPRTNTPTYSQSLEELTQSLLNQLLAPSVNGSIQYYDYTFDFSGNTII